MSFKFSWRWFGPDDRISPEQARQAGASHIVTALHQVPVGEVWTREAIRQRQEAIEAAGLRWEVVESLPVSEDIKRRSGDYQRHIENYRDSLQNLAACGIRTVCYNFMPILDWSRTGLELYNEDGSYTSGFELHRFAAFDLFVLQREGAEEDYPQAIRERAGTFYRDLDEKGLQDLKDTILYGLPGSLDTYSLEGFREMLDSYKDIGRKKLKEHLALFLNAIIPTAEECGIRMAIHPDDPPWNLLGLPRIVSSRDDLREIVEMQPSLSNGITLCTGSLGAGHYNELPAIAEELAGQIHFLHLRNVVRDKSLNFREEKLLEGDVDVIQVLKVLLREGQRRRKAGETWELPLRPDHGHQLLGDLGQENYPGYSLYGRMKNLAEIRGLVAGLRAGFQDGLQDGSRARSKSGQKDHDPGGIPEPDTNSETKHDGN